MDTGACILRHQFVADNCSNNKLPFFFGFRDAHGFTQKLTNDIIELNCDGKPPVQIFINDYCIIIVAGRTLNIIWRLESATNIPIPNLVSKCL